MNKRILVSVVAILLVILGLFIIKKNKTSQDIVKIDNVQKEITFCGHPYLAREVMIDGINIVKRISNLMEEKDICKNWAATLYYGQPKIPVLDISKDQDDLLKGIKNKNTGKTEYYVTINVARFVVILEDNSISLFDDFEGKFNYFGNFK